MAFLSSHERDLIYFSIIARALLWRDLFLKPPGISMLDDAFNRTLGMRVLWGVAPGVARYKLVQEGLNSAVSI